MLTNDRSYLYHTLAVPPGIIFPNAREIFLRQFSKANVGINLHCKKIVKAVHLGRNLQWIFCCQKKMWVAIITLVNFWLKASEIL